MCHMPNLINRYFFFTFSYKNKNCIPALFILLHIIKMHDVNNFLFLPFLFLNTIYFSKLNRLDAKCNCLFPSLDFCVNIDMFIKG